MAFDPCGQDPEDPARRMAQQLVNQVENLRDWFIELGVKP